MDRIEARAEAHVVARGRVQGVYFRASVKQQADQRRVSGWVRNRPDGAVEAVLQGPRDAVEAVVDWMRVGPRGAVVEALDIDWSEPVEQHHRFDVVR